MGLAIIVPNVDYSSKGLGAVTPSNPIPLTSISIAEPGEAANNQIQMSAVFTPSTTTERSVEWSIIQGTSFATINQTTGLLTILEGADNSPVVVRCVSAEHETISATKSLSVTYEGAEVVLDVSPNITTGIEFGAGNAFILDASVNEQTSVGSVKYRSYNQTGQISVQVVVTDANRKILSFTPVTINATPGEIVETDVQGLNISVPAGGHVGFKHTTGVLRFDFTQTDYKTATNESGSSEVGSTFASWNYSGLGWNIGWTLVR